MQDTLEALLVTTMTPEAGDVIRRAVNVLNDLEAPEFEYQITEIIAVDDAMQTNQTVDAVVDLLNELCDLCLREHEIVASEDADLGDKVILLEGLLAIEGYELGDDLIAACESSDNSIEALAEVLSLVGPKSTEETMLKLDSVGGSLIRKIISLSNKTPDADPEEELHRERVRRLKAAWSALGQPDGSVIAGSIRAGLVTGLSVKEYISLLRNDLLGLEGERLATDLFLMSLVSDDFGNNPFAGCGAAIDELGLEPNVATGLIQTCNQQILKYTTYESNKLPTISSSLGLV